MIMVCRLFVYSPRSAYLIHVAVKRVKKKAAALHPDQQDVGEFVLSQEEMSASSVPVKAKNTKAPNAQDDSNMATTAIAPEPMTAEVTQKKKKKKKSIAPSDDFEPPDQTVVVAEPPTTDIANPSIEGSSPSLGVHVTLFSRRLSFLIITFRDWSVFHHPSSYLLDPLFVPTLANGMHIICHA